MSPTIQGEDVDSRYKKGGDNPSTKVSSAKEDSEKEDYTRQKKNSRVQFDSDSSDDEWTDQRNDIDDDVHEEHNDNDDQAHVDGSTLIEQDEIPLLEETY